jgi:hypothetical protein
LGNRRFTLGGSLVGERGSNEESGSFRERSEERITVRGGLPQKMLTMGLSDDNFAWTRVHDEPIGLDRANSPAPRYPLWLIP